MGTKLGMWYPAVRGPAGRRLASLGAVCCGGDCGRGARSRAGCGSSTSASYALNYRLTDGGKREDQVVAADEHVNGVASEMPKILMGDFSKGDEIEVDLAPDGAERLDFRVLTSTTPQA